MNRNYPKNYALQPIKGVFVFRPEVSDSTRRAQSMFASMRCEVLATQENRMTVRSSRENLQQIKQSWLANDPEDKLSRELNELVQQIIIGGNVY